jgi:hypothetical protein
MYEYAPKVKNAGIVLFTFGKDSLLSYAISEEIGVTPTLLFIEEPDITYFDKDTKKWEQTYENKHKHWLIDSFTQEFKKPIFKIDNKVGHIRFSEFFNVDNDIDIMFGTQLTEYALLALPFNNYFRAKYIIYGNEASCSTTYQNKDELLAYPVYDQSNGWTVEISKILRLFTRNVSAMSVLEPIHEIAITRILHKRYPQYAKYQTSCFASSSKAKNTRWCHCCSKCARIYIHLRANNIDPRIVGFKENMFKKEKLSLYSLFGDPANALSFDVSRVGRDEQLLSFYLSYKNGAKGYVIDQFKKQFLREAKKRKHALVREYFGIHDSITMPARIKKKVLAIYKEELKGIRKELKL